MKLCFDSRHIPDMGDVSDDTEGFTALVSELKHEGYEFIILGEDLQDGVSKMAARDVLWIPYPSQSLDRDEIAEIKKNDGTWRRPPDIGGMGKHRRKRR